jgi:hypothetical protein
MKTIKEAFTLCTKRRRSGDTKRNSHGKGEKEEESQPKRGEASITEENNVIVE